MFNKEQLKQILTDQRTSLLNKKFGVKRQELDNYSQKEKLPHVLVITGLRRVGKSTFLRQIIKEYYSDKNFYYINFEDERFLNFQAEDFNHIYEALLELYGEEKTFFIDEIQNIQNFETFVRRFFEQGFKFIITGSNAALLSKEIGTKLTGRYIDINIKPFSFLEYLGFKGIEKDEIDLYKTESRVKLKEHFDFYLKNGGIPEYVIYQEKEILKRIYEDIIIKDIAVRYKVDNLIEMSELYQYLITNFANKFSYSSLKKLFKFGSAHTVKKYISYLEQTFFIRIVNKFDYSLKKQIVSEKKIYTLDNGFIPIISNKLNKDNGWLLENYVFNKVSSNNQVYYFNGKNECDLLLQNNNEITTAVQVCWELNNTNKEREINGLVEVMNEFKLAEGLIITSDQEEEFEVETKKIKIKPAWKWSLEKEN